MKPLYIEMRAFGSYQEERIDFTKIDHGLFLITGDTGAGKTTIFDAITYALYGETSGGRRDGRMMRSQYAPENIKTEVKFCFLYGGQQYTVIRSPEQPNWKKDKDTGVYKQLQGNIRPAVELILPDGTSFPGKIREVNSQIARIIGLSCSQFTQVAMLAQGDFMKLLHASSEERRDIFAKIFDTRIYALMEEEIKRRFDAAELRRETNRTDIKGELDRIRCVPDSELSAGWNEGEYRGHFSESDRAGLLEFTGQICREGEQKQRELLEERKKNESELTGAVQKLQQAQAVNRLLAELAETEAVMEGLRERAAEVGNLKQRIEKGMRAGDVWPLYSDFVRKQKDRDDCRQRKEQLSAWVSQNRGRLEQLAAHAEEAKQRYEADSPQLHARIHEIRQNLSGYKEMERLRSALEKGTERIAALEKELREMEDHREQTVQEQKRLSDKLSEQRAAAASPEAYIAVLRTQLREGEPCPVCGQIHHSSAAAEEKITGVDKEIPESSWGGEHGAEAWQQAQKLEQDLKAAADQADAYEKAIRRETDLLVDLKVEKGTQEASLKYLREQLTWADRDQAMAELCQKEEQLHSLETDQKKSTANYAALKAEMDSQQGKLAQEQQNLELMEQSTAGAGTACREALAAAGFVDEETLLAARLDSREMEDFQKQVKDYEIELQVTSNNLERLRRDTKGKAFVDTREFEKERDRLALQKERLEQKDRQIHTIVENNRAAYDRACVLYELREKIDREHLLLRNLNDTAGGRKHMKFQTYVQRYFFKRIISSANKRLYKMSGGQFILQCRDMKDLGRQGYVGLDLDVYSLVNEQSRDVKTLSGGESFMAALSMALGMADIIQSTAGSVHIDTMFIDEGFGSLSEETRNQAIAILNELSGGKRLVGIISHVSELKAQVEVKLAVSKTDKGSRARWEM